MPFSKNSVSILLSKNFLYRLYCKVVFDTLTTEMTFNFRKIQLVNHKLFIQFSITNVLVCWELKLGIYEELSLIFLHIIK